MLLQEKTKIKKLQSKQAAIKLLQVKLKMMPKLREMKFRRRKQKSSISRTKLKTFSKKKLKKNLKNKKMKKHHTNFNN